MFFSPLNLLPCNSFPSSRYARWDAASLSPWILTVKSPFTILTFIVQLERGRLARCVPLHISISPQSYQSQVRVVEHKRSKKLYALKYIDKARCIRQKAVANIIQERRLLEEVRGLPSICIFPGPDATPSRSTTHSLSIYDSLSKMTTIASLCWT